MCGIINCFYCFQQVNNILWILQLTDKSNNCLGGNENKTKKAQVIVSCFLASWHNAYLVTSVFGAISVLTCPWKHENKSFALLFKWTQPCLFNLSSCRPFRQLLTWKTAISDNIGEFELSLRSTVTYIDVYILDATNYISIKSSSQVPFPKLFFFCLQPFEKYAYKYSSCLASCSPRNILDIYGDHCFYCF